ncbi:MAG: NAD-dependent epimerase/dehydratase family protein, partial [Pseudomonadota bacterium]
LFASPRADIGNGEQLRDFIHVDDCIDHMLHLRANGAPSGIYNSATGEAHSFRFITETVFDVLGLSPVIRYIPMPDNVRKHYQYFTEGTMERYCRATGRPATAESFTDRIADYVRNYLEPTRRWR